MGKVEVAGELLFDAVTQLLNTGMLLNFYMDAEAKKIGYNRQYGRVLVALLTYEMLTQTDLSMLLLLSRQSIGVIVDKMEREGLVKRKVIKGNRRANNITVTRKGIDWVMKTWPQVPEFMIRAMPPSLSKDQIQEFRSILKEFRKHIIKQTVVYRHRRYPMPKLKLTDLYRL